MRNILIVDDEPEVVEGLLDILRQMQGVMFHTAGLATQALKQVEKTQFDLVIADIRMPGISGIEMWEYIHRQQPHCRVVFLSGVRDFDNVYRAIQNPQARFLTKMESDAKIRSTVETILEEIASSEKERHGQQQKAMIAFLNDAEEQRETEAMMKQASFPIVDIHMLNVLWIGIAHAWALPRNKVRSILQAIKEKVSDGASERLVLPINMEEESLLLLLPCIQTDEELQQRLQSLLAWGYEKYRIAFIAGYAYQLTGLAMLKQAHLHMVEKLHEAQRFSRYQLVDMLQLMKQKNANRSERNMLPKPHYQADIQSLQSFLELGQEKHFFELFDALFEEYVDDHPLNSDVALQVFYSVFSLARRMMMKWKLDDLHATEAGIADNLQTMSCANWKDTIHELRALIESIFACHFPEEKYRADNSVRAIQAYIQENIGKEMTLNHLSEKFGFHPNYLSRLFKESTGKNLFDYITHIRLGAAEVLLRTTREKINTIAIKVGYESAHSFIRAFRKAYQKSPMEYRAYFNK